MMSTSFSEEASPVTAFRYRDMRNPGVPGEFDASYGTALVEQDENSSKGPSPQQISDLLERTRAEAIAETETRLRHAYESAVQAEALTIRRAVERFTEERKNYFFRIEAEVVQLALAIASRILHREAQVDPMLVAALVRVAVDKLHDGSSVSVRVSPLEADKWRKYLANPLHGATIQILEDAHLTVGDCILETDLGSANFSIDAQLKEVEQGFFDLLAQRPAIK